RRAHPAAARPPARTTDPRWFAALGAAWRAVAHARPERAGALISRRQRGGPPAAAGRRRPDRISRRRAPPVALPARAVGVGDQVAAADPYQGREWRAGARQPRKGR